MKSMFYPILSIARHSKLCNNNYYKQRFIFTVNVKNELVGKSEGQLTETFIKEKLLSLSVPFTDGYTCFHLNDCKLCAKKVKTNHSPVLYLNKRTGFFLCEQCKISGSWSTFIQCLEKTSENSAKNKNFQIPENVINKYKENLKNWEIIVSNSTCITDLSNNYYSEVLKNFNLNYCSKSEFEKLEVRISKDSNLLYFPLFSSDATVVGYKVFSKDGKTVTFPSSECSGFLTLKKKKKTAVIVAEIKDFIALMSQELDMQIICLPYGVSVLPQCCLPSLEKYQEIILWLGGIETLDATFNFANKLNNKRCKLIRPVNNQKSAQHAVNLNQNIVDILNNAKSAFHECIITFNSLRDEVLAQLQNKDHCSGVRWKRFPALNQILKGHRRGELTVLTGPTGSGKTTFISEYSLDLAEQGVNTLWGSFEIKNSYLAKKMLQQYARLPLEDNLDKFNTLADKFEELPIFFMSFHGQHELSVVMDAVEHCSYVYDIAHVIIDNVQFMINIESDNERFDRFFKQDLVIQKFRKFATEHNCHVTLVMHPRKVMNDGDLNANSIFGGVKATQEADNILLIQNRNCYSFLSKKVLQVGKNRYSGDLGTMSLNFNKLTSCFTKNPTENMLTENYKLESQRNKEYFAEKDGQRYYENYEEESQQFNQHFKNNY